MVNKTLINQGVTKECAKYCMQSIIQYLNGDTEKFEEYANKALKINEEIKEKANWLNCRLKVNGVMVKVKINMATKEIRDLEENILREGVNV